MKTADNPRQAQENKFFGLNGTERLDGGLPGRFTEVKGVHYGADLASFTAAQEGMRSYNDGLAYVLVDNRGVTWANVLLETFQPEGAKVQQDPYGGFWQPYTARLRHLT